MVRVWSTLLVLAAALAVGWNVSYAKEKDKGGEKKPVKAEDVFKKLDADKDGKLSEKEFTTGRKDPEKAKGLFKKIDTDRDGFVSLAEFKAFSKRMEERAAKKKDKKPEKN
jgi:Ca2+-binding EF-hand superfamily protein